MPIIKILNRDYQVNCGPGEEKKLFELAETVDKRLRESEKVFKGANENLLMVLTLLILEDQTHDLQKKLDEKLDEATKKINDICKLLA